MLDFLIIHLLHHLWRTSDYQWTAGWLHPGSYGRIYRFLPGWWWEATGCCLLNPAEISTVRHLRRKWKLHGPLLHARWYAAEESHRPGNNVQHSTTKIRRPIFSFFFDLWFNSFSYLQYVPAPIWSRFIAGLNAQLRTLRQANIHSGLNLVLAWISSHANPRLDCHGVKVELGWFQGTASGYYQLGILVSVNDSVLLHMHRQVHGATSPERPRYFIAIYVTY